MRAGSARAGRRPGWRAMVAGLAVTAAALVTGTAGAPPAAAAALSCGKATGPFSVQGTQVRDGSGGVFISYGITVPGLQVMDWRRFRQLDLQKIAATATSWCANTVRLQLNQDNLLRPDGTGFDTAYMAAIEAEVSAAERYHLVVVLNDNTEFASKATSSRQLDPTPATETFWKYLTGRYGSDPQVIFDLFNEPRTYSPGMSQADKWRLWLHGGWYQGVRYQIGMAELAGYVRNTAGARNVFWIEGPDSATSFAGMISRGALLKVSGVVYSVHHPAAPHDIAAWDADFGYLARTGVAPVVDGEWTNYEPPPTAHPTKPRTSCWSDAPASVPLFLWYLSEHLIGLNVYQLQPGYMIKSYANMADPTMIDGATWSCASNREPAPGQGAGSEVLAFFRQRNG
jgi:Cellulase (glycosyl hydrolase family 5)